MSAKKVGLISLGCSKNLVDSEVMLGLLGQKGCEFTKDASDAEIMVINTCAFIEDSKKESIDTILEIAELKKTGKLKKLVVTGCLAQRYKAELETEMPEIDHLVGTGEFQHIADFVAPANALPVAKSRVGKPSYVYDYATPRISTLPKHTAYVKIAEGCSRTCSFCIIPKLRGPGRSRSISSIVQEVQNLCQSGTKEIHLIAQDLTAYGLDRDDGATLESLLRELRGIDGLLWIRLMYNYPMYFTDSLIQLIAESPNICNYLDMPLQHIDSSLLLTMRRKIDEQATRQLLRDIRSGIPNVTLRTTLIVGFPGETKVQFEKLYDFVEENEFDRLGVFTYSQEEGTGAGMMKNQVSQRVKNQRRDKIMKLQQKISMRKNQHWVGENVRVLIDREVRQKDQTIFLGRTEGQALDIDGQVFISHQNAKVGEFTDTKITSATEYDLYADAFTS
ncbi:MAG: 30S ribosomal protein S12 methylthiotransferase RimO [Bdellovibrionales bacterium]|nr:30S ribosomal protein S12 methylthiotransferase RimO [Bdellovibrionales bacterium]